MESEMNNNSPPSNLFNRGQELLKNEVSHVYKKYKDSNREAHFLYPEDFQKKEQRTTIVFFHGGMWDKQMIDQFVPQALHFVLRGAIVVLAEYSVSSLHHTTPLESIQDAQSLILWLRQNHIPLGVDPQKIITYGTGSGAHIALCAALNEEVENNGLFDSRPNALILFSSIISTLRRTDGFRLFNDKKLAIKTSPNRCIRKNAPPMTFYHGEADQTTKDSDVEQFTKKLQRKRGNICRFYSFPRGTHSFFNFNVDQNNFVRSLANADSFLSELGYLKDAPPGTF